MDILGYIPTEPQETVTLADDIVTNTTNIATNTASIALNNAAIIANTANIATNTATINSIPNGSGDILTLAQKTNTTISTYTSTATPTTAQIGYQVEAVALVYDPDFTHGTVYSYGLPLISEGVWQIDAQVKFAGGSTTLRKYAISTLSNEFDEEGPSYKQEEYTAGLAIFKRISRSVVIPPGTSVQYYVSTSATGSGNTEVTVFYTLTRVG